MPFHAIAKKRKTVGLELMITRGYHYGQPDFLINDVTIYLYFVHYICGDPGMAVDRPDWDRHRMFWQKLRNHGDRPALIDGETGERWTYAELDAVTISGCALLEPRPRKVVLLLANNDAGTVISYLSALKSGHTLLFYHAGKARQLMPQLLEKYRPDIVIFKDKGEKPDGAIRGKRSPFLDYTICFRDQPKAPITGDTVLCISTSGSTGVEKMVRLSRSSLTAGAVQVAAALNITGADCAICSLPISFVIGLSVINSHLESGGALVLTGRSILDRTFWALVREKHVTTLPGITWMFQMMRSMHFSLPNYPHLRKISHTGSRLDRGARRWLVDEARANQAELYFMYGQTEANGRMCVLPPSLAAEKPDSVGFPVQGGTVSCDTAGNITYRGSNVMLGYATCREDLSLGDALGGVLSTGDIGHLDADGCLYITGRTSRFCKVLGMRINLDEVEAALQPHGNVAVVGDDDEVRVYLEGKPSPDLETSLEVLSRQIAVPRHKLRLVCVDELQRLESGKIRYDSL